MKSAVRRMENAPENAAFATQVQKVLVRCAVPGKSGGHFERWATIGGNCSVNEITVVYPLLFWAVTAG